MTLIYNILSEENYSGNKPSAELLTALNESESGRAVEEAGLGEKFRARKGNISSAFQFEDLNKTVTVKSIEALDALATKTFAASSKKYAICLALLIANKQTKKEARSGYITLLRKLYATGALKKSPSKQKVIAKLDELSKDANLTVSNVPAAERLTTTSKPTTPGSDSSASSSGDTPERAGSIGSTTDINFFLTPPAGGETPRPSAMKASEGQHPDDDHKPEEEEKPVVTPSLMPPPVTMHPFGSQPTSSPPISSQPTSSQPTRFQPTPTSASTATTTVETVAEETHDQLTQSGTSGTGSTPPPSTPNTPVPSGSGDSNKSTSRTIRPSPSGSPSATVQRGLHEILTIPSSPTTSHEQLGTAHNEDKVQIKHTKRSPTPSSASASASSESPDSATREISTTVVDEEKIDDLLDTMSGISTDTSLKDTKEAQYSNFIFKLKTLSDKQLEDLNDLMQKVQDGEKKEEIRFDVIRKERYYFGHGNTATWQRMRHDVKAERLDRLEKGAGYDPQHPKKKVNLRTSVYQKYFSDFNQHTSHLPFFNIGKTATAKKFANEFKPTLGSPTTKKR